MSAGNAGKVTGQGVAKPAPSEVMDAFDALPQQVRKLVAGAILDMAPAPMLRSLMMGADEASLCQRLQEFDAKLVAQSPSAKGRDLPSA